MLRGRGCCCLSAASRLNFACGVAVAAITSAVVAGVTSANLGMALKAGLIAFATAMAFNAVGDVTLGPGIKPLAAAALGPKSPRSRVGVRTGDRRRETARRPSVAKTSESR